MTNMPNSPAEIASMSVAAIVMLAFLLQKFLSSWKVDKAESAVLTLMHEELERMSKENSKLATELSALHADIIRLNKELGKLTIENQKLNNEVALLTSEINRLQNIIVLQKGAQSGPTS